MAPASTASRTWVAISAMSSALASSSVAPRSPITYMRSAAWGMYTARSIENTRRSSASRYSGKVSHSHWMPSWSAVPGMSSTPSIISMSIASCPGRTGAKPTPQLPTTTVVTPCDAEGSRTGSQVACPS